MAPRSIRPRLLDILENIDIATSAVAGHDQSSFAGDPVVRLAVERAVSEAVRHIPDEMRRQYPSVPWRNIVAIGNKLRHEYYRVDPDIILDIAQSHLAALKPIVKEIYQSAVTSSDDGRRPADR